MRKVAPEDLLSTIEIEDALRLAGATCGFTWFVSPPDEEGVRRSSLNSSQGRIGVSLHPGSYLGGIWCSAEGGGCDLMDGPDDRKTLIALVRDVFWMASGFEASAHERLERGVAAEAEAARIESERGSAARMAAEGILRSQPP